MAGVGLNPIPLMPCPSSAESSRSWPVISLGNHVRSVGRGEMLRLRGGVEEAEGKVRSRFVLEELSGRGLGSGIGERGIGPMAETGISVGVEGNACS